VNTYVLTSAYKRAATAHRERHPDIPACAAYITGRWERVEMRHARLLNLNPCHDKRCFPNGWDATEGTR